MPVSCNRGDLAALADHKCSEFFCSHLLLSSQQNPAEGCLLWRQSWKKGPPQNHRAASSDSEADPVSTQFQQEIQNRLLVQEGEMRRAFLLLLVVIACEAGAPSSIPRRQLLEDDVEIP